MALLQPYPLILLGDVLTPDTTRVLLQDFDFDPLSWRAKEGLDDIGYGGVLPPNPARTITDMYAYIMWMYRFNNRMVFLFKLES